MSGAKVSNPDPTPQSMNAIVPVARSAVTPVNTPKKASARKVKASTLAHTRSGWVIPAAKSGSVSLVDVIASRRLPRQSGHLRIQMLNLLLTVLQLERMGHRHPRISDRRAKGQAAVSPRGGVHRARDRNRQPSFEGLLISR